MKNKKSPLPLLVLCLLLGVLGVGEAQEQGVRVVFHNNKTAPVKIGVYDRTGRLVSIIADANFPSGKHDIVWHCTDLKGNRLDKGVYFLRVFAGGFSSCKKLTVIR